MFFIIYPILGLPVYRISIDEISRYITPKQGLNGYYQSDGIYNCFDKKEYEHKQSDLRQKISLELCDINDFSDFKFSGSFKTIWHKKIQNYMENHVVYFKNTQTEILKQINKIISLINNYKQKDINLIKAVCYDLALYTKFDVDLFHHLRSQRSKQTMSPLNLEKIDRVAEPITRTRETENMSNIKDIWVNSDFFDNKSPREIEKQEYVKLSKFYDLTKYEVDKIISENSESINLSKTAYGVGVVFSLYGHEDLNEIIMKSILISNLNC